MKRRHAVRISRWKKITVAALVSSTFLLGGCPNIGYDTDLGRVFRQAYVPGLIDGLTTAVTTPADAETGLRATVTAFINGVGTLLTPENARP